MSDKRDVLFVYGTLVEAATRRRLLGRAVVAVPARMPGYRRGRARHFYVARDQDAETAGMLLAGLSARDFDILDRYEEVPRLYTRERATALDERGHAVNCWVYMPTSSAR